MMSSGSRYRPYPSFTIESRAFSQRHNNQPIHQISTGNGYGNQLVPCAQFANGNYPGNFKYNPGNSQCGSHYPWHSEFGVPPHINQGWGTYPIFSGPQPPAIQKSVEMSNESTLECGRTVSPMLSHLLMHTNSCQSPIPSVSSSTSSEMSVFPSVEPSVIQIEDDNDPIAEAMAAVGLEPGLIHEIKEQARKGSICPTNLDIHSPNQNNSSVSVNQSLVSAASGIRCPICNSSHSLDNHKKHLFNHMIRVIIGMERANKSLVLWMKENYPMVLERTVYCQLCKSNFGDFTRLDMRLHVEEIHRNKPNNKPDFEQIFDSCFPMWNQQELVLFGFSEIVEQPTPVQMIIGSAIPIENFCPVCSNMPRQPNQQSVLERHAKHMRQHLYDLIAGREQPNPKLTFWLKLHAPLSLERNIFCRICRSACSHLSEHARRHSCYVPYGKNGIDFCFPKWTPRELCRFGFTKEIEVRSSGIPKQRFIMQSFKLTCQGTARCNTSETSSIEVLAEGISKSFELPRSNFDIVLDKSLESQTSDFNLLDNLQKFDIDDDDDRLSTPSPGRLVIDIPDESYSPALAIEEIVDDEEVDTRLHIDKDEDLCSVDKTVDINMHVDNYNSFGVETSDTSVHIAYDDDDDSCGGVDKTVDTVASSYIGNDECSCGVDKIIGNVDTNMDDDNIHDSCCVDKTVDTVLTSIFTDNYGDSCCVHKTVAISAHIDNSAELFKNAAMTQHSPIASNSSSTGANLTDDISVDDAEEATDFSSTLYPSSPGFVSIDPCPTSPFESPISPCAEQSGFIIELSPASAHSAVNDSLYSDHELFNLVFPSEADKIEAAMAELTFWNKDYYGFFGQLAKFPTSKKQD